MRSMAKTSKMPSKRLPAIDLSAMLYPFASAERFRAMKLHFSNPHLQTNPLLQHGQAS